MIRYSLYRLAIFAACVGFFWLIGLRRDDQMLLLLGLSAVVSLVVSYFALQRQRDRFSEQINARLERRLSAQAERHGVDEAVEDAGDESQPGGEGRASRSEPAS